MEMFAMREFPCLVTILVLCAVAQAQAQTAPRTEAVTVRAGTPQKVAFYPAAKRDCTRTPLPEIRQTSPGQLVLFIAKPGYQGKDSALYAVRVADQDAQVRLDVRVTASPSTSGRMIDL
jgi:hypothetical protein